jgi:hypothetical protein
LSGVSIDDDRVVDFVGRFVLSSLAHERDPGAAGSAGCYNVSQTMRERVPIGIVPYSLAVTDLGSSI